MKAVLRRGQSVSDYVIAVGLVGATMATMQVFIQRYVQAKIKDGTDSMMAISTQDASKPQPWAASVAIADERGMATQRLGNDFRLPSSGFNDKPDVVAEATSTQIRNMHEQGDGTRRVIDTADHSALVTNARSRFKGQGPAPTQLGVQPDTQKHPWFRTDARKKKDWERWQAKQAHDREVKARKKYEAERRAVAWDYAKQQARACYANNEKDCAIYVTAPHGKKIYLTRATMENPEQWAKFVKAWNKGRNSKTDPLYLDPNDPSAAWEKIYGVKYGDAGTNCEGPEYAAPPTSWLDKRGFTDTTKLPYVALLGYFGYALPTAPTTPGPGSSSGAAGGR